MMSMVHILKRETRSSLKKSSAIIGRFGYRNGYQEAGKPQWTAWRSNFECEVFKMFILHVEIRIKAIISAIINEK